MEQFLGSSSPILRELAKNHLAFDKLQSQKYPKLGEAVVVAVVNQKGGVGKTTTAVNLAAALAIGGLKVCLIDSDPQGNASTALNIPHDFGTPSIYEVILGSAELIEVVQDCGLIENLVVCPATIDLAGAEVELVGEDNPGYFLKEAVERFLDVRKDIDIVVIDCPPSLGLLTVNALVAADLFIVPVQAEYYALEGLKHLLGTVDRLRVGMNKDLWGPLLLLTMVDRRTKLSSDVAAEARKYFPTQVFSTDIPRSVRISEAPGYSQTVVTYEPKGAGAIAYRQVATELVARIFERQGTND